jgi:hypothetical protein
LELSASCLVRTAFISFFAVSISVSRSNGSTVKKEKTNLFFLKKTKKIQPMQKNQSFSLIGCDDGIGMSEMF